MILSMLSIFFPSLSIAPIHNLESVFLCLFRKTKSLVVNSFWRRDEGWGCGWKKTQPLILSLNWKISTCSQPTHTKFTSLLLVCYWWRCCCWKGQHCAAMLFEKRARCCFSECSRVCVCVCWNTFDKTRFMVDIFEEESFRTQQFKRKGSDFFLHGIFISRVISFTLFFCWDAIAKKWKMRHPIRELFGCVFLVKHQVVSFSFNFSHSNISHLIYMSAPMSGSFRP